MKILAINTGFWKVWLGFALFMLPLLVIFPYLETELKTFLFSSEIPNLAKTCESYSTSRLKYIKLLKYNRPLKKAKVYCLFEDTSENLSLDMVYQNSWKVIYTKKINSEKNFYWPVYI